MSIPNWTILLGHFSNLNDKLNFLFGIRKAEQKLYILGFLIHLTLILQINKLQSKFSSKNLTKKKFNILIPTFLFSFFEDFQYFNLGKQKVNGYYLFWNPGPLHVFWCFRPISN